MIRPPYLQKDDKIAIVSPARSVAFEAVFPAMKMLQRWGLEVVLGTHVFGKNLSFSGSDKQRCEDFQQMLDDPSIKAIVASRGGYGSVRIIDGIDFSGFLRSPKWIAGFSDITVFHAHIHRHLGIETIHSLMPYSIQKPDYKSITCESFRKALFGEPLSYTKPGTRFDKTGITEGILTGGNLSILVNLIGTASEPDMRDRILFLEDVEEYLYHLDRMMVQLKRSGKLKHLRGLIVGGLTAMKESSVPFGKLPQEIILDAVKSYNYPVCFDFPSGHEEENVALYLGRKMKLMVDDEVSVVFEK